MKSNTQLIFIASLLTLSFHVHAQWNASGSTLQTDYSEIIFNKQKDSVTTIWLTPPNSGPGIQGHYYIRAFDWWGPFLHFKAGGDGGDELMTVTIDGKLGVGVESPSAAFHMADDTFLGSSPGSFQLLRIIQGRSANRFMNNIWLYRDNAGSDWLTARQHDGISIDNSFLSPGLDTKTWWERDPYNNIQSWGNANVTYMTIKGGNVGIGTNSPDSKLTVAGKIHAQEIKVTTTAGADFVFEADYPLRSLEETEQFIKENKHLPDIPSADEMVEEGITLGEMNVKLLQKIEELTLYVIELQKQINELKDQE